MATLHASIHPLPAQDRTLLTIPSEEINRYTVSSPANVRDPEIANGWAKYLPWRTTLYPRRNCERWTFVRELKVL